MRRIYDSNALHRDDTESHAPRERDREIRPQAMRSVPSGYLSKLFVPYWLRYRAISITVDVPDRTFPQGERIPFTVTMQNRLPVPITIPVNSPIPWTWSVDDYREGSRISRRNVPEERRGYHFDRGERKQFTRHWSGSFKVAAREWEPATAGEHSIGVGLNVDGPESKGLYDESTFKIDPD